MPEAPASDWCAAVTVTVASLRLSLEPELSGIGFVLQKGHGSVSCFPFRDRRAIELGGRAFGALRFTRIGMASIPHAPQGSPIGFVLQNGVYVYESYKIAYKSIPS